MEKRGGGNGPVGEHGETERDVSHVDEALLDSVDGDRGPSNVKFSLNMVAIGCSVTTEWLGVIVALTSSSGMKGRCRVLRE